MIPTYIQSLELDPTSLADPHRHKRPHETHIMIDFDPPRSFYHDIKVRSDAHTKMIYHLTRLLS